MRSNKKGGRDIKGILFTKENIELIAAGKKTQTRRIEAGLAEINERPNKWQCTGNKSRWLAMHKKSWMFLHEEELERAVVVKPRYLPSETVYIKEPHYSYGQWLHCKDGWLFHRDPDMKPVIDYSDWKHALHRYSESVGWYRRSGLFLEAKFARYFLTIKDVRPERLQEIEKHAEDYRAEGYQPLMIGKSAIDGQPFEASCDFAWYENLWDSINKKAGTRWLDNPYVWRYVFSLAPRPS